MNLTGQLLITSAALLLLYMSTVFSIAQQRQRLDAVDIAWGPAYVIIAWMTATTQPTARSLVVAVLVSVWGCRLGWHIWQRFKNKDRVDPRYAELSQKWHGNIWLRAYFSVFLLQGVLIWVISLPIVINSNQLLEGLAWLTFAGSLIWLIGFAIEAVADRQLQQFLANKHHPKVLQTGLWRYSRHPNYFGELTQWWGIGLIACQVSYGWFGLVGPLVLSLLIIFVSGIPPIERRRSKDQEYRDYMQRTSSILLWPPRHTN